MFPVIDVVVAQAIAALGAGLTGIGTGITTIIQFLYANLTGLRDVVSSGFTGTWQYLTSISSSLNVIWQQLTPISKSLITLVPLVSFLGGALADPQGFANSFMCGAVDLIVAAFPSTPNEYKIGTLVTNLTTEFPESSYLFVTTFEGIFGIFAIYLGVKALRFLPFF